jgi:hypothetical protein
LKNFYILFLIWNNMALRVHGLCSWARSATSTKSSSVGHHWLLRIWIKIFINSKIIKIVILNYLHKNLQQIFKTKPMQAMRIFVLLQYLFRNLILIIESWDKRKISMIYSELCKYCMKFGKYIILVNEISDNLI